MTAQWLLSWWNLIFLLPFSLALLYLGLYTASGITFGDADVDHDFDIGGDVDADTDTDIDHDVDADHDLDADHDVDSDHDADSDADSDQETQAPIHVTMLGWMGVGRVPVSIVLMVLLLTWGVTGFLTNAFLQQRGAAAAMASVPLAALTSIIFTHVVVTAIARYLPLYETTAKRRHALLGCVGEAILPIDQKFGMVGVRDATGDLYQVPCRADQSPDMISKGTKVQLVSYNAKQGLFCVRRHDQSVPQVMTQKSS
jgi:membrane protein implicated in regulation of membrane protease activity